MVRTLCCDVGSSEIRVAIFEYISGVELNAVPLAVATRYLNIYNLKPDFYEQKTKEIWSSFCDATRECLQHLNSTSQNDHSLTPFDSIGFSATCSLVIVEDDDSLNECDVIMWMDHRAKTEAKLINQSQNSVLNQFGGICSPEFSLSKLLWLHKNQFDRFKSAKAFMELPDWLCYSCSQWLNRPEEFPRSLCSVVCKWGYDAVHNKWPEDLFNHFGLSFQSIKNKIGSQIIRPGLAVGYLNEKTAREIGIECESHLLKSITIASPLIDAHAGTLSMLAFFKSNHSDNFENVLCMISGTSTCHMILNHSSLQTRGIWGPYLDVIIPGYYLKEAGQSATGKLIEHIITTNIKTKTFDFKKIIHNLNEHLNKSQFAHQTSLIVNPTFHGNRSPIADSRLKGAVYGMTLVEHSLMDIYVSTIEAIAYEAKFILEKIQDNNPNCIEKVIVSGGLTKNDAYLQMHADILDKKLLIYDISQADHMLIGAAIVAFTALQSTKSSNIVQHSKDRILDILNKITITGQTKIRKFEPRTINRGYHHKKYKCYRKLVDCCLQMEDILMSDETS